MRETLLTFQRMQKQHDIRLHEDIHRMATINKIKHYTFHLVKYLGRINDFHAETTVPFYQRALIDSFIILLAYANALQLRLSDAFTSEQLESETFLELGETLYDAGGEEFSRRMSVYLGVMAKACEAYDHLEQNTYRAELEDAVSRCFLLVLRRAATVKFDLEAAFPKRHQEVEEKSLFGRRI